MNEPKYRLKEAMPYQNDETLEPWRISLLTKFLEIKKDKQILQPIQCNLFSSERYDKQFMHTYEKPNVMDLKCVFNNKSLIA